MSIFIIGYADRCALSCVVIPRNIIRFVAEPRDKHSIPESIGCIVFESGLTLGRIEAEALWVCRSLKSFCILAQVQSFAGAADPVAACFNR
jgi:hypothetical protein